MVGSRHPVITGQQVSVGGEEQFMRRGIAGVRLLGCVAALAFGLAACGDDGGGSGSGGGGGASGGNGDGETFKIVMSNGFVSQWRTEMQNIATAMSQNNEPY